MDGEALRDAPDAGEVRVAVGIVASGAALSVAAVLLTCRFLYADAAYFLLGMWERGSFFVLDPSRWVGLSASQWLPATSMLLGWRSPRGVALLYGVNLWLNPLLAIAGVWLASRRSAEVTAAVALAVLFLFHTAYGFIESEATVLFCLATVWFVLTLRPGFHLWLIGLLALLPFTHESYVLLLTPVLGLLLAAGPRYRAHYGVRRYWALVIALAVVSAYQFLPASFLAGPPDDLEVRNQGYFLGGALSLPGSPALVLSTLATGAALAATLRPRLRAVRPVFWTSVALLIVMPFALPQLIWPFYHYRARILHAAVAFLVFLYLHARFVWGVLERPRPPVRLLTALAVAFFVFQGATTLEWRRHLGLFRAELGASSGVVAFPVAGPFATPRARQFEWSWTTPVRSIVFQAMETGEVRTIILNADTTIWQPFDPRVADALPDLSGFGVRYAPEVTGPR